MKYYSLKRILEKQAHYNIIIGERSNGKTYAALRYGLERAIRHGETMAIVRRWQEDFRGKRGASMFNALVENGDVSKLSNGKYNGIYYFGMRWYLCNYNEKGEREITEEFPFCYGFSISNMEHDKSTSYHIHTIIFDEFLTRNGYLPDEFVLFMNVLSTIIRQRNDVKIFMLGNTINKYSPYFSEFGLTNIKSMKPGDIDVYTYGDSDLRVAVEFADSPNKNKPSNVYFAFDNPRLSMITGKGSIWEMAVYPHKPCKFKASDIVFTFFIEFNGDLLQCEIVELPSISFIFVHRKTTELQNPNHDLIFSPSYDPRPNWRRKITKPVLPIENKIVYYFRSDKIFYQDNEIGEIMRNYLQWCNK